MSPTTVQDIASKLVSMGVPKYGFDNFDGISHMKWCANNRGDVIPEHPELTFDRTVISIVSGDDEPWSIHVFGCSCCENISLWQCFLWDYDDSGDIYSRKVLELQTLPSVEVAFQMARTISTMEGYTQ